MMIGWRRFNIYLLLLLALAVAGGCEVGKGKKPYSTLRVYLEVNPDGTDSNGPVPISRETPMFVNVQKAPFLTEVQVNKAKVVDVFGGFVLQIEYNQEGSWLLEQYTASNPGKHFAIQSIFGAKTNTARWLAAPKITRRITNGTLTFTPDATREESDQIVLGLNNLAEEVRKKSQ